MLANLTLSLTLLLAGAPADLAPASPALGEPAPVRCADATLSQGVVPTFLALGGPIAPTSTCSEDCNFEPDISCSGSSCNAVARNCPGQRGYVVCDGVYTYCAVCPVPECTNGRYRQVETGVCCSCSEGEVFEQQQCVDGQWQTLYSYCSPGWNCPLCP